MAFLDKLGKMQKCWCLLILAIILEVAGTSLMKFFANLGSSEGYVLMILFISCSYLSLSKAVIKIPISTAYAVWEGVGLVLTACVAYFIFHETMTLTKFMAFSVILCGLFLIKKGTVKAEDDDAESGAKAND